MSEDLDVLVGRANHALQGQPGFLRCGIESLENRVLVFFFEDDSTALQFQTRQELLGVRAVINDSTPTAVYVSYS